MAYFYIATRGNEAGIARARAVRDALVAAGHTWTFDWTLDMEKNFAAGRRDTDLTFDEKQEYAVKDRDAVLLADIVIYLQDEKSEGSAGEFCYAEAKGIETIAVCAGVPRCLFVTLATHIVETDADAIALARDLLARHTRPRCQVCGEPQFEVRGGTTCKNGHGGAPSQS